MGGRTANQRSGRKAGMSDSQSFAASGGTLRPLAYIVNTNSPSITRYLFVIPNPLAAPLGWESYAGA